MTHERNLRRLLLFLITAMTIVSLNGTPLTLQAQGPTPHPQSEQRCGDGVCDGPETTETCPQDCVIAAGESTKGSNFPQTGTPGYEPPINVVLILHIDPEMDRETDTFQEADTIYNRTYGEIDWLMDEAARHNLRFTSLYNGWYPKMALEQADLSQFQALLDAGHEIGSHAHRLTYDQAQDLWIGCIHDLDRYGRPNYDTALARQSWDDADRYVDAVLAELGVTDQNQTMTSLAFTCSDEAIFMQDFGFSISAGSRAETAITYMGHIVWNPWRPTTSNAPGHELEEDLSTPYITIDHLAQIGSAKTHGMDLSVPQLQRRFLMLYIEWLSRERYGVEDRVWTFGFVVHPNYGDRYNADLVAFLDWLDTHFIGHTSPYGNTLAQYATIGDIAQQFETWEAAYPGTSSFSWVVEMPYPYTYAAVPTLLENAAYETHVDLGAGVTCFRLSQDNRPIYLVWSDTGEQTVDFSGELAGQVLVTTANGDQYVQDAAQLQLSELPLFVTPQE